MTIRNREFQVNLAREWAGNRPGTGRTDALRGDRGVGFGALEFASPDPMASSPDAAGGVFRLRIVVRPGRAGVIRTPQQNQPAFQALPTRK